MYIPGKVLLFYQDWEDVAEVDDETTKEEKASAANGATPDSTAQPRPASIPYKCRVTDGTALALQTFEVDGFRCIGDHTTAAYYQCLGYVAAA